MPLSFSKEPFVLNEDIFGYMIIMLHYFDVTTHTYQPNPSNYWRDESMHSTVTKAASYPFDTLVHCKYPMRTFEELEEKGKPLYDIVGGFDRCYLTYKALVKPYRFFVDGNYKCAIAKVVIPKGSKCYKDYRWPDIIYPNQIIVKSNYRIKRKIRKLCTIKKKYEIKKHLK